MAAVSSWFFLSCVQKRRTVKGAVLDSLQSTQSFVNRLQHLAHLGTYTMSDTFQLTLTVLESHLLLIHINFMMHVISRVR